jgi:FMN-dependent dehydrogenase/Response regulator receiver domain
MPKASLVSVVEDDQFFRESMRRLMRSFGYAVEAFASAADFLASARLVETGCLIADVNMPAMNGLELGRVAAPADSGCDAPALGARRPLSFGNIAAYTGRSMSMNDYAGFIGSNFDPTISWKELESIRDSWKGKLLLKGVIDPEDARDAVRFGADGVVVSNHGGRQLDGAIPTARALPDVVDAVGDDLIVLADGGIRSGARRRAHVGARRTGRASWPRLYLRISGGRAARRLAFA